MVSGRWIRESVTLGWHSLIPGKEPGKDIFGCISSSPGLSVVPKLCLCVLYLSTMKAGGLGTNEPQRETDRHPDLNGIDWSRDPALDSSALLTNHVSLLLVLAESDSSSCCKVLFTTAVIPSLQSPSQKRHQARSGPEV